MVGAPACLSRGRHSRCAAQHRRDETRELLLRKKAKTIVVATPPSVIEQWKAELEERFGLQFEILDRAVPSRFEHRLFLSATPHNGHSNSFSTLLELLDPYRFTRGAKVRGKRALEDVMVRRLKDDIREVQGGFPKREVIPLVIDGRPHEARRAERGGTARDRQLDGVC
jgi:SNF2 family DNA or RNA helicase